MVQHTVRTKSSAVPQTQVFDITVTLTYCLCVYYTGIRTDMPSESPVHHGVLLQGLDCASVVTHPPYRHAANQHPDRAQLGRHHRKHRQAFITTQNKTQNDIFKPNEVLCNFFPTQSILYSSLNSGFRLVRD